MGGSAARRPAPDPPCPPSLLPLCIPCCPSTRHPATRFVTRQQRRSDTTGTDRRRPRLLGSPLGPGCAPRRRRRPPQAQGEPCWRRSRRPAARGALLPTRPLPWALQFLSPAPASPGALACPSVARRWVGSAACRPRFQSRRRRHRRLRLQVERRRHGQTPCASRPARMRSACWPAVRRRRQAARPPMALPALPLPARCQHPASHGPSPCPTSLPWPILA